MAAFIYLNCNNSGLWGKEKDESGQEVTIGSTQWPKSDLAKNIPEFKKGDITAVMDSPDYILVTMEKVDQKDFLNYLETNSIIGLLCTLQNTQTGEFIELNNSSVNSNYSVGEREGKSIFDFIVDEPGRYELNAWYESDKGEEAVLAVGKGYRRIR